MMVVLENKWNVREDRVRYFAVTSRRLVTAVTAPWRETSSDVSLAMLHVGILIRRLERVMVFPGIKDISQSLESICIRLFVAVCTVRETSFIIGWKKKM